jgi:hypothetical protein
MEQSQGEPAKGYETPAISDEAMTNFDDLLDRMQDPEVKAAIDKAFRTPPEEFSEIIAKAAKQDSTQRSI